MSQVQGIVRARGDRRPVPDLFVEVRSVGGGNASSENGEVLGTGRTDGDGRFAVGVDPRPAGTARRRIAAAVYREEPSGDGPHRPIAVTRPRAEPVAGGDLVLNVPDVVVAPPGGSTGGGGGVDDSGDGGGPGNGGPSGGGPGGGDGPARPRIPVPRSQGQLATERLQLANATKRSLHAATSAEMGRRLALRREGATLGRRLMAIGGRRRLDSSGAYVVPGSAADDRLEHARLAGVERLTSTDLPGMTVHLDEQLAGALFPDGPTAEPVHLPPDLLDGLLPSTAGASRLADLLTACRAEHAAVAPVNGANGSTPEVLPGEEVKPPAGRLLAQRDEPVPPSSNGDGSATLAAQLAALLASEPGSNVATRPGVGAIGEDLSNEVPPGPADTTAYYDFHRLQVAWQDTWTSALDGMTVSAVGELYEALVDVVDPEAPQVDTSEIDELGDLLQTVADTIAVANGIPGLSAPPELVTWLPDLAGAWTSLSPDDQEWIRFLQWVDEYVSVAAETFILLGYDTLADALTSDEWPQEWFESVEFDDLVDDPNWGRHEAEDFLAAIDTDDTVEPSGLARLERLLGGLNERLAEPYQFDVFVPNSYNFGILTTYRQRWQPLEYQVGDLVGSLPLSPGETRSFETKKVVKTTRTQKEVEHSIASRSGESTTTGRVEAEIVQKASHATNFAMTAQGSVQIEVVEAGGSTSFGANQAADSAETKRDIRESTVKAAQEYRDERTLEVSSEESITGETVEKRTISNPNNELTVTYLLYELQRRFEVAEQLYAIRPVVLVAFDVPSPDEIDEGFLVANAWILRRSILDDRFLPALDYLTDAFAGDELRVEILAAQWDAQMRAVQALQDSVETSAAVREVARAALLTATSTVANRDGFFLNLGEALFPSKADDDEIITAQSESAQQGLEWADADLLAQRNRLELGVTALQQATDTYVNALTQRTSRRVAIDQLRVHVKENILHYMQAIWSHEPTDQRYFRLYDLPVQWPETDHGSMTIQLADIASSVGGLITHQRDGMQMLAPGWQAPDPPESVSAGMPAMTAHVFYPAPQLGPERLLHEVADVDNLLGFKGNYAMFPLREGNAITDYMAQAYLDSYFGVIDPDPFGRVPTTSQAVHLAECAWNREGTTDADRAEITAWLVAVMAAQERISQEIVVATGQLFMEALPGAHPLLEDFKLRHRAIDLERAAVDVKVREVELLRRAARLVQGDLSDPDIEQRIDVNGAPGAINIDVPAASTPASASETPAIEPA